MKLLLVSIVLFQSGCITAYNREREMLACRTTCGKDNVLSYSQLTGECSCLNRGLRGEASSRNDELGD